MADERSAGAVLFYQEGGKSEPEFLLLNYAAGHWDFPKGNIERGEEELEAATREIREETGITGVEFFEGFRTIINYRYRRSKRLFHKEVVFFLARAKTKQVVLSHEHVAFAWKKYEDAMESVTYDNAKNLLTAAKEFVRKRSAAYRR